MSRNAITAARASACCRPQGHGAPAGSRTRFRRTLHIPRKPKCRVLRATLSLAPATEVDNWGLRGRLNNAHEVASQRDHMSPKDSIRSYRIRLAFSSPREEWTPRLPVHLTLLPEGGKRGSRCVVRKDEE